MPDAGDFDRDSEQRDAPIGWGEAFAALPQEAPDAGGWQRMQARLPAPTPSRVRWPLWLATAASLLLAMAIPLRMLPQAESIAPPPPSMAQASSPVASAQPSASALASPSATIHARPTSAAAAAAARDKPRRVAPSQRPIRTAAQPAGTTRLAATDSKPAADLEPLYARSAQLEDLLALARDERVANGTSAALSDELDARVAGIDTALIQPGLSDAQRADLWGQRVDALQQLVGIETTNRLYAARGQTYAAALVSVD